MKPCLFGKKILYFLLFIDDYSRKTWVYFLKEKFNVFSCFKKFKTLVEKESDYSIKSLRTNSEGEFCSNDFNEFCKNHGIKRLLTMPRSPQQNDVVERKNISILNMARNMLKTKKIPKEFWAKVVDCAIYLSNRCLTKNMNGMTHLLFQQGVCSQGEN